MKKTLKALLIIVIVVALIIGSVAGVTYYKKENKTVDVYSVSLLNLGYYSDSTSSSGVVKNDASQSVYVTDGQKVVDVYVTEGQQVSVGDPLMEYDISSLEISVEMKKLEIQGYQNEYDTAQLKLTKLKNTTPIPETQASSSQVSQQDDIQGTENPGTESSEAVSAGSGDINSLDMKTGGSGTADDPYVFKCASDSKVSGTVLNCLKENSSIARFDAVDADGNIVMSVTMNGAYITKTYGDTDMEYIFSGNHASDDTDNSDSDDGSNTDDGNADDSNAEDSNAEDNSTDENSGYTAKQLAQEIASQERNLTSIDIKKRKAESELETLEEQLKDGKVYSKVNGVVKTVHDMDDMPTDGSAFMVITGSEGLYIEGSVSELLLDKIKIGQPVTAYDYDSGNTYTGTISEIDSVPTDSNSYYGDGNPNVSYYGYTAYIEDPSGLTAGQYLQLTIDSTDTESQNKIYIEQAYVREEDGKSYVYKDNNGRLEKQYVETGSILWGSYIEILSGLTTDDNIAFPYGQNVADGVRTVVKDTVEY